ncbi:N-acetylmuramoyl-L-alanine amidase [Ktedonosporobacter rubrisoli]|uniref:N-acetylmuramoyl-L-alanine amidase n=1 Tax=Ktedonosporobacter rubrisoli TaxID=2509675 RepID=A0A4P6JRJ8_KTERU|nr:peptidoglycan recognition family protein [Ktedonosporobacter rubrisoli]QBD77832.1 N-acetylmuramoyl-L-alanine amidase [Ktedonosporobacter rubrisoli]
MLPDEPGVTVIADDNYFSNREGYQPNYIILHGTAGGTSAEAIANYFQSTQGSSNPVSSHYVIGRDGEIVQCVSESDGAWANGYISAGHDPWWSSAVNPNDITVSIEHCKPSSDNSDELTAAQKDASFRLIKHICQRHNIPARKADGNGGITGHFSIDPVNRANCPGPYPWDELWSFLQQSEVTVLQISQVSQYFEEIEKDQRWHCKVASSLDGKQHDIAYGLLAFYRTFGQVGLNGLSIFGLPTSDEIHVPGTKQAAIQFMERGAMLYDPGNEVDGVPGLPGPCFPAHIDKGPGQDPRIATLTKQVTQLQTELQNCNGTKPSLVPASIKRLFSRT